jgi:kynurenine formamidase
VIIRTGWDTHWTTGNTRFGDFSIFPNLSVEAAEYLSRKNIYGIGTDTPSIDRAGKDNTYPAHHIVLGAGQYLLEKLNLISLSNHFRAKPSLQPVFEIRIAPTPLKGTAEAPVNVVVLVKNSIFRLEKKMTVTEPTQSQTKSFKK